MSDPTFRRVVRAARLAAEGIDPLTAMQEVSVLRDKAAQLARKWKEEAEQLIKEAGESKTARRQLVNLSASQRLKVCARELLGELGIKEAAERAE